MPGCKGWLSSHHFEPLAVEQMIYSRQHSYAGTIDFPAMIDGRCSVVEWKTAAAIYPEFRFQVAAYAEALWEMNDRPMPHRWIVRLGKDDDAFEAVCLPREEQDTDFRAFLGAEAVFERLAQLRNRKPQRAVEPPTHSAPADESLLLNAQEGEP